ncbi:hypothetical protein O181_098645 [Austropuccinia psidii MF-1]|uniref:VTT domain-containing protein n=1 Tax=Austropuccinia psidii MF-1 TaxID=1389203 RepID=A0A9Q3J9M2_9BASI|nr:hypothetical protein [Austropuccinia psidii MF-1]
MNSLQLLNPTASPEVGITPTLSSSNLYHHTNHQNNHHHHHQQQQRQQSISQQQQHHHHHHPNLNQNQTHFDLSHSSHHQLNLNLSSSASISSSSKAKITLNSLAFNPSPSQASFPPLISSSRSKPLTISPSILSSNSNSNSFNNQISPIISPSLKPINHSNLLPIHSNNVNPTLIHSSLISIINPFNSSNFISISKNHPILTITLHLFTLLFTSAFIIALTIWIILPPIDPKDLSSLRIPTNLNALKNLNNLLQSYKAENYYRVLNSFILIYLFLQTFSLPGSMYLSILAGAMFGIRVGLPLVCCCVATGAMLCYLLSYSLASKLVLHSNCLRKRLENWKSKLSTKTNKFDLFIYLILIRISPLPPHWVVNLLAPHVGINPSLFWFTTFLGILPISLIHTQLGTTLDKIVQNDQLSFFNSKNLTGLTLVAIAIMIPVFIRWYFINDCPNQSSTLSPLNNQTQARSIPSRLSISFDEDDESDQHIAFRAKLRNLNGQTYESIPDNSSIFNIKITQPKSKSTNLQSKLNLIISKSTSPSSSSSNNSNLKS